MNRSTDMDAMWLPQAHFGYVGAPVPAPAADPEPDPDDELLPETPPDVVAQLGFDPRFYTDATQGDGVRASPAGAGVTLAGG